MFTIKVIDEPREAMKSHTVYECFYYRVEYHVIDDEEDDDNQVFLYLGGAPLEKSVNGKPSFFPIEIENVAYVMNSDGKTVDTIYSCVSKFIDRIDKGK